MIRNMSSVQEIAMRCKVLFCLWLLGLIKPGFSEDVSVPPGSSIVLNCSFTLPPIVDHSLLSITWSFNGSVIASKNHSQPGFFLNTTDAFFGSFPLTVYNTTQNQQGVYECSMSYNDTDYSTDVTLTIVVPPMVYISSLDVVLKRKCEIECWAKGFSPPQIIFTWTRAGEKIPAPYKLLVNRTEDGLYDAVSILTFIPDLSDRNTTFGCEVQHKALLEPTTKQFKPRVIVLPKVTLASVSSGTHTSLLTLSCDITGFFPHNISVLWIQNGEVLPEHSEAVENEDGMYKTHRYHTLSLEERKKGGEVQCVAQQPHVSEPAYGTLDLSTIDPREQNPGLNKSAKASVALMIISLTLVFLLCFGFSWNRRDEKLKSLNISAIVLPPRVVVGRKGRVTISVEGKLADRVQTAWFLNDVPIKDTSYTASEKGLLLSSTAAGYYKLHTQLPLGSSFGTNKQLFSSLTFIPNLSIHKGAVFKCRISYKGKDKTVAERVSDKFTILAPPQVSEIQFSEPNGDGGVVTMTAQATHFHPDIITFRWFCQGGELCPVSVPPALAAPRRDGESFFSAMSQCRLPKAELERGETRVWVTVHHMALKRPITRETRGFMKKPTISEITPSSLPYTMERPLTLACDIIDFYPPEISIKWLHLTEYVIEDEEETKVEIKEGCELWGPLQNLPRTFRAKAILKNVDKTIRGDEIICRVSHCSLLKPIERVWKNIVVPSIPSSLSVCWSRDGVRIFSILLVGGNPNAKVLWAAGGATFLKLLSKETEKYNSDGKVELKSVCAVVKSQESRRGGHTHKIRSPVVDLDAEYEMMNTLEGEMKSVKEAQPSEQKEHIQKNNTEEEMQLDSSCINRVCLTDKRQDLSVTVEITHPALSLPVYLSWKEPVDDSS
ncbi:uncharacterized protein si:ch211-180a12.2 isoform X2 [Triplophysa dalaica]|uniref:uncharacterized protein si:ch211-180a12.2 isoform X2 n=1 Tax=Triplophysa dalaica TaxID=1582913 RepID=UPI0024E02741|nr:uncharacterized protein si:ch211-180a12.2 isoform X2 [Triplophysa dalaica]